MFLLQYYDSQYLMSHTENR